MAGVNGLFFHVNITYNMIVCNMKVEENRTEISGNVIKKIDKVRFLRILIDDKISFYDHL